MMRRAICGAAMAAFVATAHPAQAQGNSECARLPTYDQLKQAMKTAAAIGNPNITGDNRGFKLEMWGTVVNRDGIVCAVVFTGGDRDDQWPGSRVISAQKANTANAFSLDGLALSTANLYSLVQPGASLFGLQESNPVSTVVAYQGPSSRYGQANDPMVGSKIGGVNVFGGGLALYRDGAVIGALGVSGDTSCADHNIAWEARKLLGLSDTPTSDNISYPAGHPVCLGGETPPAP